MPHAWRKMTCAICGNEFMTQSVTAKYCSEECKSVARRIATKEYAESVKRLKQRALEVRKQQLQEMRGEKPKCEGCEWKAPGYPVCVMPRCLKGLKPGKEEEDEIRDPAPADYEEEPPADFAARLRAIYRAEQGVR